MKLATLRNGTRDGRLLIVSRDLTQMIDAHDIAPNMQAAIETWSALETRLMQRYEALNEKAVSGARPYDPNLLAAPLPRAWQWLDGSAFPSHGALMQKAFNLPPIETTLPLMYQGMSHHFLGAVDDVPLPSEADGIDFEGEFGVIVGDTPMGTAAAEAGRHIRLAVQINDWSLRVIAPVEMKTGFGWIQAKPACSMAPVAVTLDELGDRWADARMTGNLKVEVNGVQFGDVPATEMQFGFDDLIAHAARSRYLCAGTVIGSGTVSSHRFRETGSCCIAERRAIEMIDNGAARTSFLRFGDQVRMWAESGRGAGSPFGEINQRVVRAQQRQVD
jgi:fumarylacetoacetate (FAA) hydrolase